VPSRPPTVAAIVPTLDRLADLRRCLDGVDAQTRAPDLVLVVDNGSTDGTLEHLRERAGVDVLELGSPVGAPAAFAAGLRAAFERGAEIAWLLDDDAEPAPAALAELLARVEAARDAGERVGGAAPLLAIGDDEAAGWRWGARADGGRGQSPNRVRADGAGAEHDDVDWAPFAGLLLTREACEQVGELRGDFELWHADVDYCLRIRRAGWRLLAAPRARVTHPPMALTSRRLLGRTFAVGDYAPAREYYDTRNRALLLRSLRATDQAEGTPLWRRAARELARDAATLAADRRGARRVWLRALGLLDGVRGRTDRRVRTGRI
jgi:GT2 family glycosyltransferase